MSGDPADWAGEYEPETEQWLAIRARPSPEVAAIMRERYDDAALAELAENASAWNLTVAAIAAGPAIIESHRHDPRPPREPSRAEVHSELRRQAKRVLASPATRRQGILSAARRDLEGWRAGAITTAEIAEFADAVGELADGR